VKVVLSEGDFGSHFNLKAKYRIQTDGSPVVNKSRVRLVSAVLGDYCLHVSEPTVQKPEGEVEEQEGEEPANQKRELNLSREPTTDWELIKYRKFFPSEDDFMKIGEPVAIFDIEIQALLQSTPMAFPNPVTLRMNLRPNLKTFFIFETEDHFGGGLVHYGRRYKIKHVCSGKYLSKDHKYTAAGDAQIALKPAETASIWTIYARNGTRAHSRHSHALFVALLTNETKQK
jgi:hypothetical protein